MYITVLAETPLNASCQMELTLDPVNTPPFNVQKHQYIATVARECYVRKTMTKEPLEEKNYKSYWVKLNPGTRISIWQFQDGWAIVNYMRSYGYIDPNDLKDLIPVSPTDQPISKESPIAAYTSYYTMKHLLPGADKNTKTNNLNRIWNIGHGAESSVFTIADICYRDKGVHNAKGLLATDLDMKVVGVKVSYYAVQNMVSVFDDSLEWLPNPPFTSAATNLSVYAWRRKADGAPLVAFWDNQDGRGKRAKGGKTYPTESFETRPVTLVYAGMPPKEPVWVDLMSGRVYAIPAAKIKVTCDSVTFADMPAYDSPCVLTERAVLKLQ